MKLTKEIILQTQDYETPCLVVDLNIIKQNYLQMKECFSDVDIFYAIKANSDTNIIKTLMSLGSKFETSSINEVKLLLTLGVKPENIVNSAPYRKEEYLKRMYKMGIRMFVYDTEIELEKFKRSGPEAELFLRVDVDNTGSDWPLSKKFGVEPEDAVELIKKADEMGIKVLGTTFHVGSQCLNLENWNKALTQMKNIHDECKQNGINLEMINLGGGIPIKHLKEIPNVKETAEKIKSFVNEKFSPIPKTIIEPGRGLVGNAGIMIAEVISKRDYKGQTWIYLDIGVFHGMMETIEGFDYEILTENDITDPSNSNIEKETYVIAGPSCDGVDVMFKDGKKMSKVEVGDRVFIRNAAAYTICYASLFNGYKIPKTYYVKNGNNFLFSPNCLVETIYRL
ncbi:type III PLP-dependent enzyme [Candidatus Woesearchaeota archaeon]|nr:type III PLP-dependent enzyme [Candidatus Woesearchaeota archaeon]